MEGNRNSPAFWLMTITVDCRWIDSSGIGVYLRGCLPFLLDSGHCFFLIGKSAILTPLVSARKNVTVLDCSVVPFSFRELFFFPRNLLKEINKSDLYYSPYFNIPGSIKVPIYPTIHDIIFPDMPELCSRQGLAARMWFYRRAFRRSRKIFTVSEFSKSRIGYYSRRKFPVIVTYSAIQQKILEFRERVSAKKKIIIFIGNIKKHKGLKILIEAFLQARREGLDYKLVIVGSRENFRSVDNDLSSVSFPCEDGSVEFTGFLPDEDLLKLVAEASLLVQPSLYEGFGLPPLEAMALGTRALVSDIPVFREIYRDFPVAYFRTGDTADLKEKLLGILYNQDRNPDSTGVLLNDQLISRYTFQKTASIILEHLTKQ